MTKIDQEKDSKILAGALIGGIVGIGAITVFLALRHEKKEPLNSIGETISHLGNILEKHSIENPEAVKKIGKQLNKNENTLCEVVDWVAVGVNLWKKFKN
ncbi:MAG: hypothetical protein K2Y01_07010 [Rhabdochlamydiaceae bacterium]|nr:hypothetical protein [Rhabdochlamydiaceae bacterium]